jgi:hypothetical protein
MESFPAMREGALVFEPPAPPVIREKLRVGQRPERLFGATRLVVGCSSSESKLEPIASKLQEAANRCVADVVERKMAYENSTHCRSLGGIARQYLQAGGFTDEAACPLPHRGDHASARLEGALAVSLETHASLSGEEAQVTWRRGGRGG